MRLKLPPQRPQSPLIVPIITLNAQNEKETWISKRVMVQLKIIFWLHRRSSSSSSKINKITTRQSFLRHRDLFLPIKCHQISWEKRFESFLSRTLTAILSKSCWTATNMITWMRCTSDSRSSISFRTRPALSNKLTSRQPWNAHKASVPCTNWPILSTSI